MQRRLEQLDPNCHCDQQACRKSIVQTGLERDVLDYERTLDGATKSACGCALRHIVLPIRCGAQLRQSHLLHSTSHAIVRWLIVSCAICRNPRQF